MSRGLLHRLAAAAHEAEASWDELIDDRVAADDLHRRRCLAALRRHPDCSDPDHPGCDQCDEGYDDE